MSNGFIWLSIETFRGHHCTSQSDAFSPRYWNSYTKSFTWIWSVQLLITTDNIIPILANSVLLLCGQVPYIRPRQATGIVLSVWWRHWLEILRRKPTVKTARTLCLCCVFCNSMEYSAPCDVLIHQVIYKYLVLRNTLVQCHCQKAPYWSQL
jgi:hypothetical protein